MKTLRHRVQQAAEDGGVSQLVVERDYAQSSRGPKGDDLERAVRAAVASAEGAARMLAPLAFTIQRYEERDPHPGGQEAFIVRVQFPWQRQPMVPVKIEVTHDEPALLPAPPRAVAHGYDEPFAVSVRTYALEEICAEKLRSTRQTQATLAARGWARSRARDFYDLWHLVRDPPERIDWTSVSSILPARSIRPRDNQARGVSDRMATKLTSKTGMAGICRSKSTAACIKTLATAANSQGSLRTARNAAAAAHRARRRPGMPVSTRVCT